MKRIDVAVGVILRDNRQVFISKRADKLHQGGKWEFPGGKREQGETLEAALTRELKEEIDIEVYQCEPYLRINFDYPDKQVSLHIYLVTEFTGEPTHLEGQQACWADIQALPGYTFPEANQVIVEKLLNDYGLTNSACDAK